MSARTHSHGTTPSGLLGIGDVGWGTHLCQLYRDRDDLLDGLVPYFAAGLENDEACLWITSGASVTARAWRKLARRVPSLEARARAGQIEIFDHAAWYARIGEGRGDDVVGAWLEREEAARARGWRGLRLSGDTSWLDAAAFGSFQEYEAQVHRAFAARHILAICSYSLPKHDTDQLLEMLRNHDYALVRRDGQWETLRTATGMLSVIGDHGVEDHPHGPPPFEISFPCGAGRRRGASAVDEAACRLARENATAAAQHLATLQRVTASLVEAATVDEVARVVTTEVREALGASKAALSVPIPGEARLRRIAHEGLGPRTVAATGTVPFDAPLPSATAFVTGKPVFLTSPAAVTAAYPELAAMMEAVATVAALPLRARGQTIGAFGLGYDEARPFTTRERGLLDDLSRQIALALERARFHDEAERANRRKDEFLAILGHELRNPLAPIATALQLLRLRGEVALRPEHEVIERQVLHMIRLVDDLLDVSRLTRGKIELHKEIVELSSVVAQAIEMASPLLEERRHRVIFDCAPDPIRVEVDPGRFAQAIANLLTNAAKYTDPGGRVEIRCSVDAGRAVLTVEDDGIGIRPEVLPTIFEPFVQGEQSVERGRGGLGLGLALVRSLVELHGGTVSAASGGPGAGSKMTVVVPTANGTVARAPAPREHRHLARVEPSATRSVLVVDDNHDAADLVATLLRRVGHEVTVAYDAAQALDRADETDFDVAILDIGLPVLDGYELAARLRARTVANRPLRLIALSGYGSEGDRERSRAAGFGAHLVKPVDARVLLRTIAG